MLAGDTPTSSDTSAHNLAHRFMHSLGFVRIVSVVWNVGMKISIACMKDVADRNAISERNLADAGENFSKLRSRNDSILNDEMRSHSAHRSERFLSALPQARTLCIVRGDFYIAGTARATDLDDLFAIRFYAFSDSVNFNQEDCSSISGISCRVH